jgi:hypothetical protein
VAQDAVNVISGVGGDDPLRLFDLRDFEMFRNVPLAVKPRQKRIDRTGERIDCPSGYARLASGDHEGLDTAR